MAKNHPTSRNVLCHGRLDRAVMRSLLQVQGRELRYGIRERGIACDPGVTTRIAHCLAEGISWDILLSGVTEGGALEALSWGAAPIALPPALCARPRPLSAPFPCMDLGRRRGQGNPPRGACLAHV